MTGSEKADWRLAAACGLFCKACSLYIGTTEEPARLAEIADRFGMAVEDVKCTGCRSDQIGFYCRQCKMKLCTAEKGIEFCNECETYPCDELKEFQAERPHRIELWENLARIKEAGYEQWFNEMLDHYACSECRTLNSAYDIKCRKCGAEPGSDYVAVNMEEMKKFNN